MDRDEKCPVARRSIERQRRGPESNRRIGVLQTPALPLGYRAEGLPSYSGISTFSRMAIPDAHELPEDERASKAQQERRGSLDTRGRARLFWDVIFAVVRGIGDVAENF